MTAIYNGAADGLTYSPPPMVLADVNGDGKPDLIGVGPTLDTLTVLINSTGTPVASAPAYHAASGLQLLAPGAIATIRGTGLSSTTMTATVPLQTTLGTTSIEVFDFAGRTILAPLLYVSPTQINFVVPESATVNGPAMINVVGNGLPKGAHSTLVVPVAAGFFTLDGSGKGAPVASAVRVADDGAQTTVPTGQPIRVDSISKVYLSLYGTGFRNASYGNCSADSRAWCDGSRRDDRLLGAAERHLRSRPNQYPAPKRYTEGPGRYSLRFHSSGRYAQLSDPPCRQYGYDNSAMNSAQGKARPGPVARRPLVRVSQINQHKTLGVFRWHSP